MKPPTEVQLDRVLQHLYDPAKSHKYYEEHKHLKGRKPGRGAPPPTGRTRSVAPLTGRTRAKIANSAKAQQRKELAAQITGMEDRLRKLEALIKKRAHEEASEDRKGKAKKERASKDAQKPDTAAEKAKKARESEKYRDKHKQELKSKSKDGKSSGGASKSKKEGSKKHSSDELKTLAKKVRGQIAVAKQKLAAL